MKQLAAMLLKCKSFKERQDCLNESLNNFSFDYPELYSMLFREMKKRELESNDPNKITKWLSATPNSYVKLHEALMLVKGHNLMAKEEYFESIKHMLSQIIESGINIEVAMKICNLIEKSPHLKSIFERLTHLVRQIKQLDINSHCKRTSIPENKKRDNFKKKVIDHERLNLKFSALKKQEQTFLWPPSNFIQEPKVHGYPHFSLNCFGYNNLEMIANNQRYNNFNFPQTLTNLTIISQEMDGAFSKWLHYLKLHKYHWFFDDLSYLEIEFIDEDNIDGFITKVNKNSITKGAQKKICISTKALRDRQHKFKDLLMALDLVVTPNELCEYMTYMCDILHYPIPNKNCVVGDQLQQDIILIMEKSLNQILEHLYKTKFLVAQSLIGTSINKYIECTLLITNNQIFMKHQNDKIVFFGEKLKNVVHRIPKNF